MLLSLSPISAINCKQPQARDDFKPAPTKRSGYKKLMTEKRKKRNRLKKSDRKERSPAKKAFIYFFIFARIKKLAHLTFSSLGMNKLKRGFVFAFEKVTPGRRNEQKEISKMNASSFLTIDAILNTREEYRGN